MVRLIDFSQQSWKLRLAVSLIFAEAKYFTYGGVSLWKSPPQWRYLA